MANNVGWQVSTTAPEMLVSDGEEGSTRPAKTGVNCRLHKKPVSSMEPVSSSIEVCYFADNRLERSTPSLFFEKGVQNVLSWLFGNLSARVLAAEGDLNPEITHDEAERLIVFYNKRALNGSLNVM